MLAQIAPQQAAAPPQAPPVVAPPTPVQPQPVTVPPPTTSPGKMKYRLPLWIMYIFIKLYATTKPVHARDRLHFGCEAHWKSSMVIMNSVDVLGC